jgi:two-component system, NtrC family, sensor kinase
MTSTHQTILIVDDTEDNVHLLAAMLSQNGYCIQYALDGQSALTIALEQLPDLILLDILMPNLNGYEVCQALKLNEKTKDIPIIFFSGLQEVFDKKKAFAVGGVDYITKPFHMAEVLARVQTHLSLRYFQKILQEKNEVLTQTLYELKATQAQLLESEKMAALGNLVAGVAHELNAPIGTGITVASTLENETIAFEAAFEQGVLKKSFLLGYLSKAKRSSQLLLVNLHRAGELLQSFKQVAVDQTYLEKRVFLIKQYIEETLVSLKPQINQTKLSVNIRGDETIAIDSYPGAFSQIVTNLVMNSINHAYQPGEEGQLCFEILHQDSRLIINYTDDGCGIPETNLSKIFEPFFTTARNCGGSGLGLHIVYNLVTQKLKGTICCESKQNKFLSHSFSTKFIINLPVDK